MRARIAPATAVLAVFLAACEGRPTGPASTDIEASFAKKAFDIHETLPVLITGVDNPCTPQFDDITLEGTLHQIVRFWDNGHFKLHFQSNLTGEDPAGIRYRATDSYNEQFKVGESLTFVSKLVSQGSTPNFFVRLHLTVNPNGAITVNFFETACHG